MENIQNILLAFACGILPALFWLWFWLREDKDNPEPKPLIVLAFFGGVLAVVLSFIAERIIDKNFFSAQSILFFVIVTPAIEELFKFFTANFLVLQRPDDDEPIDPMIYMITVALGFAAVENAMFILDPFINGQFSLGLATSNLRFVGASLLHIIASATVGTFIGLTFYKTYLKKFATVLGLILAIALHGTFNFFIMKGSGVEKIVTFGGVWICVVFLIFIFEKIKRLKK